MKTIPSFQIDHNILKRGIYISRIDDDITTYDIRMKEPNREPVLTNSAIHTSEHIFATYVSQISGRKFRAHRRRNAATALSITFHRQKPRQKNF